MPLQPVAQPLLRINLRRLIVLVAFGVWPNIIPPSVSIWEASSPPQSQGFTLVGALFIIPVILMYTVWSYYVFRGKVHPEDGYH